jgi:hypothetical protein
MKSFFLSLLMLSSIELAAQEVTLSGKVTDANGQPVSVASVSLHNVGDNTIIVGTSTSSVGLFSITAESKSPAVLRISHLVFETKNIELKSLKDSTFTIVLIPKTNLLGEITVTASRPKYRIREDGNMVVAVDKIPGAENDNAFDLLKKLPGVIVSDNQGISLNGMGIEIQLNGRSMPYVDVMTLLKSLPAYSLDEIELISIKGAEHDGNSEAIINLKMKKQRIEGYFGMVGGGGRYYSNNSHIGLGNGFIMFKEKNVTFSNTLGYEYYNIKVSGIDSTHFGVNNENIVNKSNQNDWEHHLSNTSTLEWNMKSGQTLFANLSLFGGQLDRTIQSDYRNHINRKGVYTVENRDAPRFLVSGNVEYQLGSLLKVYYGYVRGNSDYNEDFENTYRTDSIVPIIHDENNLESQHIGKVDFLKKFTKFTVKAGLKETFAQQENSSLYLANVPVVYQDIDFTANENILAGYIGLDYKISDKINASFAFRGEHTDYSLKNKNRLASANPDYWNSIPSGHLTIKLTSWYTLTPYFTSSVTRPQFQTLLPGEKHTDDYNYTVGNPYLKAIQNYYLACSNSFPGGMNLTFGIYNSINQISNIKIDKGNGITENTYIDAVDTRDFRLSSSLPFQVSNNRLSGNVNFKWTNGKYLNERNGFVILAGKDKKETMDLSGSFNYRLTPCIGFNAIVKYSAINKTLQIDSDPYATIDLGVNMQLLKNKQLSASLTAGDIFNSTKKRYKQYYDSNVLISDRKVPSQYIEMRVSYRFNGGKGFNKKDSETNEINRFTK